MSALKVAIAHDYLTQRGGAERVVLAMSRAFPDASIYTTLYDPDGTFPEFRERTVISSPLNRIGPLRRNHRLATPLLPLASSLLRPDADVVLCSSSGWAHGFSGDYRRLVYCYSPARWLYCTEDYLGGKVTGSVQGLALAALRPALKRWDRTKARSADRYLAISSVIVDRMQKAYGFGAPVVPAPNTFTAEGDREPVAELDDWRESGWFLVVSRLLPYKNVKAAIEAFRGSPHRLVIVGRGPLDEQIRASAPPNVRLLRAISDAQLRSVYDGATALIAPSYEDFGLTPLEAGSFGVATLALRAGGYLDTIDEGVNGVYFDSPTSGAIRAAVDSFEPTAFRADAIAEHLVQFSEARFAERLRAEVDLLR